MEWFELDAKSLIQMNFKVHQPRWAEIQIQDGVGGSRPLCRSEETDEGLGGVCGKDGAGPSW